MGLDTLVWHAPITVRLRDKISRCRDCL